jgi:hypothetical protein
MIIAWRIQSIVMLGRAYPHLPCDVVFDDLEWCIAFVIRHHRLPTVPPSLADMIATIASFGGYLARKSDPLPGPKAVDWQLQSLLVQHGYAPIQHVFRACSSLPCPKRLP